MNIVFGQADLKDIEQLIDLRIAYMLADFGHVSAYEEECIRKQLPDYYQRKLGKEYIVFVARDGEKIVSIVGLHVMEIPASVLVLNGFQGALFNVYTDPAYRGKGLCSQLIKNILAYGKEIGLRRIDLSATKQGYSVYKKHGFKERDNSHTAMRYTYE